MDHDSVTYSEDKTHLPDRHQLRDHSCIVSSKKIELIKSMKVEHACLRDHLSWAAHARDCHRQ
jgi:hypothetical protein